VIPAPLLDEINAAPDGRETVAFFDMDGTLVSGFTAFAFALERMKRPAATDIGVGAVALRYQLGRAEFVELLEASTRALAGTPVSDVAEVAETVYRNQIASWVYPESRTIISNHRARGHRVVLISAANDFQVRHVAEDLGVDHVICNHLAVDADGLVTGEVTQPVVYGPGKAAAAIEYAQSNDIDLENAFFYTDGYEDLPLLDAVGHPQPLNPDRKLAKEAKSRGWTEASFNSRGRPTRAQIIRTVMAQSSVVPAATAGLLTGFLNGSKRLGVNLTMSTWGDYATSLAGVRVDVVGEEHLWAHRPCVFMFNHQSNFDGIVLMKLLRRDVTAIAKSELKHMPIVGQIFSLGDVVFIDRNDSAGAVDALKHATTTFESGLSIAIAPEGTRQRTPALGSFKKGGFHLAIAAQVPIVPIVIHNSLDVLPRGTKVMRPATVRVDVLPAVPTEGRDPGEVDDLLDDVRVRFLSALGQA
jgi:putative phosphoserine phosphatase/1-acylglycerol-3-phosphate O-acyltransferase